MSKKCEFCGRFMALTDRIPMDDDFDWEAARAQGFNDATDSPFSDEWVRFTYINDQWECDNCQVMESHDGGKRYYFNPETLNYDLDMPRRVRVSEAQS